ncbi:MULTISPECIES: hypothetical protein [Enterococcus]|uniref:hypothetical protein n=1 Tax=Enterococcus TaxID=1350 RepID=UPI00128711B6|nr:MULTISPECIES: hypothetical protein [Enterococcus]GER75254.1 hypothetical protein EsFM111_00360 [Enterococcus sp. FM11-1]
MKLEELERDYRSERRQLEAQEDELIHFKNQGLRLMEQEEQRLHHVLKNLALDNEPLFKQDEVIRIIRSIINKPYK